MKPPTLIASGEYRPFMATEGMHRQRQSVCQADPEWVEFGRKERITVVVTQQAREEMEAMAARIASMRVEELEALESSVMQADSVGGSTMTERCYRLADRTQTVEVRGDAARDALVAHGYGLVSDNQTVVPARSQPRPTSRGRSRST